LIEKIIDTPIEFRAIEIQDAVTILMNRRIKQTDNLQKEAKKVIENFKKTGANNGIDDKEKAEFILIPKKMVLRNRSIQSMNNAEKSVDIIITLRRLYQVDLSYFIPANKALERGVTIRVITEKPRKKLELPINTKSTQKLKEQYYRIYRYTKQPITNEGYIFDRKEVYILITPHLRLEESPALWSNHPSLVDIAQSYFENLWNDSLEIKQE
jgi:hypothetical protein